MEMNVEQLLEKFYNNPKHANKVKDFSLIIFEDVNKTYKELTENHKRMLSAAALLHDIGYYVDEKNHNKHSQKMIMDYGLEGYNQKQKEIISCVCRYHRGSLPDKDEHDIYCYLDKAERKTVKKLGGILKIADGLAHIEHIGAIRVNYDSENNITEILLKPEHSDFYPDINYVIRKKDLFEIGFKTQVIFKFER